MRNYTLPPMIAQIAKKQQPDPEIKKWLLLSIDVYIALVYDVVTRVTC